MLCNLDTSLKARGKTEGLGDEINKKGDNKLKKVL